MISLGPWLLFDFPPSTPSRAENQQQPRSPGNHLSAPCGIIYYNECSPFVHVRKVRINSAIRTALKRKIPSRDSHVASP